MDASSAMQSATLLRSIHYVTSPLKAQVEKPGFISICNASFSSSGKHPVVGFASMRKLYYSPNKIGGMVVSCVKTAEATLIAKLDGDSNGAVLPDSSQKGSDAKISPPWATFPVGVEELVHVLDETSIAQLKLKVGDFEMSIKGKAEAPIVAPPVAYPTVPPQPPSTEEYASAPSSPKSSAGKSGPYVHVNAKISAKLANLEASGASDYVLVPSPTVGVFRRGRTLKGKKQPSVVKEGDVIKEGQTIGFVDQLGTELPVKSNVGGEVLKVLYEDGEAVGYGDTLIAVRQ